MQRIFTSTRYTLWSSINTGLSALPRGARHPASLSKTALASALRSLSTNRWLILALVAVAVANLAFAIVAVTLAAVTVAAVAVVDVAAVAVVDVAAVATVDVATVDVAILLVFNDVMFILAYNSADFSATCDFWGT